MASVPFWTAGQNYQRHRHPTTQEGRSHRLTAIKTKPQGESETGKGRLLPVEEVAALLYVPVSWVYGRKRKRSVRERLPGLPLGKYWRFREEDITAWLECQNTGAHHCLKSVRPSVPSTRMNSASLSRDEIMAAASPVSTESRRLASRFVILFLAPNGQVAAQTILATPRRYGRSSSLSFPER